MSLTISINFTWWNTDDTLRR